MSDIEETTDESQVPDELTVLKQRADMMGIQYHPSIGLDKLKAKVNARLENTVEESETKTQAPQGSGKKNYLTEKEFQRAQMTQRRRNASKLIRIRVVCMDPNKASLEGEWISVGSAKLGTFKKYVQFNAEDGWHVPNIIYEHMKERKCSVFQMTKGPRGEKIAKAKQIPAYSIEVLPPLSRQELKELAQRQAMAGSID